MEPEEPFSVGHLVVLLRGKRFDKWAAVVDDGEIAFDANLPFDIGQHCHVVRLSTGDVQEDFQSEAGPPNGVGSSAVIFCFGELQYELGIVCPLVIGVDWHVSSWEEDPVEFGEHEK